jgi:hypothetical protein
MQHWYILKNYIKLIMIFDIFTMNDIAKPTISFCDKTKRNEILSLIIDQKHLESS